MFSSRQSAFPEVEVLTRDKFGVMFLGKLPGEAELLQTHTGMDEAEKSLDWNFPVFSHWYCFI